jgi:hypothetical protein
MQKQQRGFEVKNGMTWRQWEIAAKFCRFDSVSEYRLWLARLKKEKRAVAPDEAKAASR